MRAKSGEGPVQLEQLQGVAVQPAAHQEGWEAGRQEEQRTDVSLRLAQRHHSCDGPTFSSCEQLFLRTM